MFFRGQLLAHLTALLSCHHCSLYLLLSYLANKIDDDDDHAYTRPTNGMAVLCSPSKIQTDRSFGATGHIPVTGGNIGADDTGLRKCCTAWPTNIPSTAATGGRPY